MRSSRPVLLAATLASAAPLGAQSGGGASAATAPQAEPRRGSLRSGRSPSGARRPGPGLSESGARPYREEIETLLLVSERERWPADHSATEFARNDFNAERSGDAFLVPAPAC